MQLQPTRIIPATRSLSFGMFLTGLLWLVIASSASLRAAQGLAVSFGVIPCEPLLRSGFFLLLVVVGFTALRWTSTRVAGMRATNAMPERSTLRAEWALGAAFGWGLAVVVGVLLLVFRALQPHFSFTMGALGQTVISVLALALGTLGIEAAFRGYLFRRLIDAAGEGIATVVLSLVYALALNWAVPSTSFWSLVTMFALGVLFSVAYLRTRALWLGWGLHFAWASICGILFGMTLAGDGAYSTIVTTDLVGRPFVSGGGFGPEGSVLTLVVVLLSLPLLYRVTRDLAWVHTAPAIVAGGYAVEAQPPAAHVAMETQARPAAAPLVQILDVTPTRPSSMDAVNEHLRDRGEG